MGEGALRDAALINEQLARRAGLQPGDRFGLSDGASFLIAGIYSDYGNPQAQVLISVPTLTSMFPDVDRLQFGLRVAPSDIDTLVGDLTNDFGLDPERIIDQRALKAMSLSVFERTFTVTAALNVLTLSVAGFAILASLLTLSAIRLPQMAPAWAMGVTRAHLARLEILRALLLAFLTFLASIPVGLGLAWVLLAVINVEAFGWRLPMYLFPQQWLLLGVLAIAAATLAALWPAVRMARVSPARLIQVMTHER